jgi:hypothetical protein
MKHLFAILLLFIPSGVWSAAGVGFVTTASSGVATNTTVTLTYSPTAGNTSIFCLSHNGATTADTCTDNLSNTLTAGTKSSNSQTDQQFYYGPSFNYQAPSGVTSITCTWTTGRASWLVVAEYSKVGFINPSLSPNTNSGNSTVPGITTSNLVSSSWVVACFADTATTSWSQNSGNKRFAATSGAGGKGAIFDNTSTVVGLLTSSGTISATANWAATALELDPMDNALFYGEN